MVAFANSLPDEEEAILFIGLSDRGEPTGVDNADKMQKKVESLAAETCYPPIRVQTEVLNVQGYEIVAVTVFFSLDKPHFSGPAFVRVGSKTKRASSEMFEDLITSRNDKGRRLLKSRAQGDTVMLVVDPAVPYRKKCKVLSCDPLYARFREEGSASEHSIAVDRISIRWEPQMKMLLVTETR